MPSSIIPGSGGATATDGQHGIVDLAADQLDGAVVFGSVFGALPAVTVTVLAPSGAAVLLSAAIHSVSTVGFSFALGAAVPAAGYKLHWHAQPVTPFGGDTDWQAGVGDLAENDESGAVVFATPFAASPAVGVTLLAPNGAAAVVAVVIHTVTVNGFSFALAAPIPAAGYKLHWQAIE